MRKTVLGVALALVFAAVGVAAGAEPQYEVTVTNLTNATGITPILVATHVPGIRLFELGSPASPELEKLAEEGMVGPLETLLSATPGVRDVADSGAPLGPGQSVSVMVSTNGHFDHVSVAAMLVPTNDGFFAVNGMPGPRGNEAVVYYSPGYDAGTEVNDELCSSIPGPFYMECGGPGGGGDAGGGEGYVHIHRGIHGIGDFMASVRDWRNPVARIVIRAVGRPMK
jgi:hypothetical protein